MDKINLENLKQFLMNAVTGKQIRKLMVEITTPDTYINTVNLDKIYKLSAQYNQVNTWASAFTLLLWEKIPDLLSYFDEIPNWMFCGCEWLTEITIPKNIKKIGIGAFLRCINLEKVTFEKGSVAAIDSFAFGDCPKLEVLDLSNTELVILNDIFFAMSSGEINNQKVIVAPNTLASIMKNALETTDVIDFTGINSIQDLNLKIADDAYCYGKYSSGQTIIMTKSDKDVIRRGLSNNTGYPILGTKLAKNPHVSILPLP